MKTSLSNIRTPQQPCVLIAVAGELLFHSISDIDSVNGYEVIDHTSFDKSENIPTGIMLMAFGEVIDMNKFWRKYKLSHRVVFFYCKSG